MFINGSQRDHHFLSYLACAIHALFSKNLLWPILSMECTEGHLAISIHSPPTGSQLIQRDVDTNSKTSSHYLISYKSESLTQEFEQDTESEQDRGWRELERLAGLRAGSHF